MKTLTALLAAIVFSTAAPAADAPRDDALPYAEVANTGDEAARDAAGDVAAAVAPAETTAETTAETPAVMAFESTAEAPVLAALPPTVERALPRYADRIIVKKGERQMVLLSGDRPVAIYQVSLGRNPDGHKYFSGDGRTPEGLYWISYKNERSQYYRSLKISYPNQDDIFTARAWGLPAGGQIMIHGQPTDALTGIAETRVADWTEGCIAVANAEMDEIWALVEPGTPVEIFP